MSETHFPATRDEAIAMLYLQTHDISDLSPEELVLKYKEVYSVVHKKFSAKVKFMDKSDLGI